MRIGLFTGGGDCPGLNAAIRAVVRVATSADDEVIGFHHGWLGVTEGEASVLTVADTKGLLRVGGTILRTARYHPNEHEGGVHAVLTSVEQQHLDAIIVIGGDGTLGSANYFAQLGLPIVGIAKTIDNDVSGTDRCIGFETAVATAAEAINRVQTTGESHDRLMVVEVMGRTTGWLAVCAGSASGADALCLPEEPTDLDRLAKVIERRHSSGSSSSIVVVAEGARFTHLGDQSSSSAGSFVASQLAERTGYETRLTVLGHIQRGGTPIPSDRLLATICGEAAVEAVHAKNFGTLVSVSDVTARLRALNVVANGARPVPDSLLEMARKLTL